MELNRIYNEDCLLGMQRIPDKSVDMILCDLPYGTTACKWDVIIPFDKLWAQYERIIKDNGAIVLTASQPFTSALVMSNPKMFRYEWIWKKTKPTNVLNAKKQPLRIKEDILVFCKGVAPYNPQGLKDTYFMAGTGSTKSNEKGNTTGKISKTETNKYLQTKTGYPNQILEYPSLGQTIHPTQKPVALFEYLIKTYTNEGETVLDNCMGSGTTAIACLNTNRNFIGFEKDATYYQVATDRINKNANLFTKAA